MNPWDRTETDKPPNVYALEWVEKIAAAANVVLAEETMIVYRDVLAQIPKDQLDAAGWLTIRQWDRPHLMPPLAFILGRVAGDAQLAAEQAWVFVESHVRKHFYADGIGWLDGQAERLTPPMAYALRQIGGPYRLAYEATPEQLHFLRRDFIAAFERFVEAGGEQLALTRDEAKAWLEKLHGARAALMAAEEDKTE